MKILCSNVVRQLSILLLCALGWNCGRDTTATQPLTALPPPTPVLQLTVSNIQIRPNPNNVLSAVVSADATNAASLRVEYAAENGSDSGSTPDFAVTRKGNEVPVLGLMPQTDYVMRIVATGADGTSVQSRAIPFQTASLPSDGARLPS